MIASRATFETPESDLNLARVHVVGIRNLADVELSIERHVTYVVGENNAGKTSLLLAIAFACGARQATADDLHRNANGESVDSAFVDLVFRSRDGAFSGPVSARLSGNYADGPEPGEWFGFRTEFQRSRESTQLIPRRSYLLWDAAERDWVDHGATVRAEVLELVSSQLVDASRDLTDDLTARRSDWGRVLADLGIPSDIRQELESRLQDVGADLQTASPVFTDLRTHLRGILKAQSDIDDVELHALPFTLEEVGRSVEVVVRSRGQATLPLRLQGLGSRSIAALMVFQAMCELRVGRDRGVRPQLITLLEEPEAHLHPQAQAALRAIVESFPGQTIVATHSPVLIAEAEPSAVRVLRESDRGPTVHAFTLETAKKIATFRRYVERPLGELFFARLVVFVDGTSERTSFPVFLEPLLGRHPAALGISIISLDGPAKEQVRAAIEALRGLGDIPWFAFVDNDSSGLKSIEGCSGRDGAALHASHDQVVLSGRQQLERLLIDSGYEAEIESVANELAPAQEGSSESGGPRLPPYSSDVDDRYLTFLKGSKGWSAEHVARRALAAGKPAPRPLVELARRIREELNLSEPEAEAFRRAVGEEVPDGS